MMRMQQIAQAEGKKMLERWRSTREPGASYTATEASHHKPGDVPRLDAIKNQRVGRTFASLSFLGGDKGQGSTFVSDKSVVNLPDRFLLKVFHT